MSKFDLGELLKNAVPETDTGREQIEYIDIDLIDSDDRNFYQLSDLESLAANIETVGLQQPLRVRTSTQTPCGSRSSPATGETPPFGSWCRTETRSSGRCPASGSRRQALPRCRS